MGKQRAGGRNLFLVVRLGWRKYDDCYDWFRDDDGRPYETGRPVAAYANRKDADVHCAALEADARACLNPFAFFEAYWLEDYSSLSLDEFEQFLRKTLPGVRLPRKNKYGQRPWLDWWNRIVDQLSDEQRQTVWRLFDRLHFYSVVSTRLEA